MLSDLLLGENFLFLRGFELFYHTMNKTTLISLVTLFITYLVQAQERKEVLLTLGDQPVYASEFRHVYKKNLDLVQDESQKSVDGYLDLFVDYKLKVREAYAQNMDQRPAYLADFRKYEEQLSRSYLYQEQITEELIEEAFQRGTEEVNASHILFTCTHDAVPQDTIAAYNKAVKARERAMAGEDFDTLIKELSEEPGLERGNGKLGYFSVFNMVYPFETMAYNTPVGEISDVVRTQYGYHVIKVNDRREKLGQIEVSHIMVTTQNDSTGAGKKRIDEIYQLIQQGEDFEDLAKQYSDDKRTGKQGGLMRPFSRGELRAAPFENRAYELNEPGEISEPIQTRFGWHIIRLEKKNPLPTLEENRYFLERKVKDGERAKLVTKAVNDQIKERIGFEAGPDYMPYFDQLVGEEVLNRKWSYDTLAPGLDQVLFVAGGETSYYGDLAQFLQERQAKLRPHQQKKNFIRYAYETYLGETLRASFKEYLEATEPQYAAVVQEYRDGLLIFEVMGDNVWNKAKVDTLGQEAFYKAHLDQYQHLRQAVADVYTSYDKKTIKKVQKMLKEGKGADVIQAELNVDGEVKVVVTSKTFEEGARELPEAYDFTTGNSDVLKHGNSFVVVDTSESIPAGPKDFSSVKGRVLSDYQKEIETNWLRALRAKYPVQIDQEVLTEIKKEFGQ